MKDIKKSKHKQSKYFTLMLVPYSSLKTKSVKIPYSFLIFLPTLIITLLIIAYLQVARFKNISDNNLTDLEKALDQNWELIQSKSLAEEDRDELKKFYEKQKSEYQKMLTTYEDELKTYEKKATELETKIEDLNKSKDELYNLLSEKIGIELNEDFNYTSADIKKPNNVMLLSTASKNTEHITDKLDKLYVNLEKKYEAEKRDFTKLGAIIDKNRPLLENMPTLWPIKGNITITSYFGERSNPFSNSGSENHLAIDLKASSNTPVYATGGGTVKFAGTMSGYGYLVIIDHGFNIETYYAHNNELLVKEGDKVSRGTQIAKSGSTGRSTGPHVHYEVRVNNIPKNPIDYIK